MYIYSRLRWTCTYVHIVHTSLRWTQCFYLLTRPASLEFLNIDPQLYFNHWPVFYFPPHVCYILVIPDKSLHWHQQAPMNCITCMYMRTYAFLGALCWALYQRKPIQGGFGCLNIHLNLNLKFSKFLSPYTFEMYVTICLSIKKSLFINTILWRKIIQEVKFNTSVPYAWV